MTQDDILDCNIAPSPDSFSNGVVGETVLLHIKRGVYYGMDPVGTVIWNGIQDGRSAREICAGIADDYSVALDTVEGDARRFLQDLASNDIIILS